MQRAVLPLGLVCACALGLACYGRVLLDDEQFAYRDAGALYYPLYQRVQQEWSAGRWPLWNPWQNGGQPLLGNPMAAVLYPGKLVFACAPYPWAARCYVVGHTIVALLGMFALARGLGTSQAGAALAALAYAFGAPVLFQYSNVIYLVGAAWTPWGLCALDRSLRQRRRGAWLGFASVVALQLLGGDPEAAYLLAVCGLGYALLLWARERARPRFPYSRFVALGAGCVWAGVPLMLALTHRPTPHVPETALSVVRLLGWGAAGVWVLVRRRGGPADTRLAGQLVGLAGALLLAVLLSAAQFLPALEFSARSGRADGDVTFNAELFSVEPYRALEFLWPNVFGTTIPENRSWVQAIPEAGDRLLWEPSLYVGGLTVLLAAAGLGGPCAVPWRRGLTVLLAVTLLGSLGHFGGALWWARWVPAASAQLGPHDPAHGQPRADGWPDDGTTNPYAAMAAILPGFGMFRYPAKLLTFTAVALAGLAGLGWDRLREAQAPRALKAGTALAALSFLGLVPAWLGRATALAHLAGRVPSDPIYGPADIPAAWAETERALLHGSLVLVAGVIVGRLAARRPLPAAMLALVLMSADLARANAWLIGTIPQAVFDARPEILRRIEEAESRTRETGDGPAPLRIFHLAQWYPHDFSRRRAPDRLSAQVAWEHRTLRPAYALPYGLSHTVTKGSLELSEYVTLFRPGVLAAPAEAATLLGLAAGDPVFYFPRRSLDMWGARYFITPARPDGWRSAERGFAALLPLTDQLVPNDGARDADWLERQDWVLLRNRAAFPRAWVVHYARVIPPAAGPDRAALLQKLLYQADPFWNEPDRPVFDLHTMAFVETTDREGLRGYISRSPVEPGERVDVTHYDPQTVALRAVLDHPGLVILSDTDYPGWRLRIDGRSAPIYRANRQMRAAAVPAGTHVLEYHYQPLSFQVGLGATGLGLALLVVLGARARYGSRGATESSEMDGRR